MAAYLEPRYKSKKAVKDGLKNGDKIRVYDPTPFGNKAVDDGIGVPIVGPGPYERKWYGQVDVANGHVTKIK